MAKNNKKIVLISLIVAFIAYKYAVNYFIKNAVPKVRSDIVQTTLGKVQGIISKSRDGKEFREYLGIPYGKAERFHLPKPADTWNEIRDASEYGPKCLQIGMLLGNIEGEEDCLFLNVHVPIKKKPNDKFHVLVFFHGGHFTEGASNGYRPDFLIDEDVILVTVNYRLGVLGFLNTADEVVRGNMGLKDQVLALKWVQQNIANFGGDPKKVTIFGESAGAACVHYHIISPMSKGLFHKAIAMSGSSLVPWAFVKTPVEQANRYGERVNCPIETSQELVGCLRNMSGYELVAAMSDIMDAPRNPLSIFVPGIEKFIPDGNTFLKELPKDILSKGDFNKVPFLSGVNSDEGLIASSSIVARIGGLEALEYDTVNAFPTILYSEKDDEKMWKIREKYFGGGKEIPVDTFEVFDNYTTLMSDRHFFWSFENTVKLQAKHAKTFVYYYTYPTEFTLAPILLALKGRYPLLAELLTHLAWNAFKKNVVGIEPYRYGICHADELALFFHIPGLTNVPQGHKDYEFSKEMVKLFVQFVQDESQLEFRGTKWLPVDGNTSTNFKYLHLDVESQGNIIPTFRERLKFWDELDI